MAAATASNQAASVTWSSAEPRVTSYFLILANMFPLLAFVVARLGFSPLIPASRRYRKPAAVHRQ
jgi:hypothetical protein